MAPGRWHAPCSICPVRHSPPWARRTVLTTSVAIAGILGATATLSAQFSQAPAPSPEDLKLHGDLLYALGIASLRLPLAGCLGAALAFRPKRPGTPDRSMSVVETQIILAIVGALIMLVVGASLARAFGIVGAANLIRYRAKIDNPKDAVVMLSALAVGLACGVGLYVLAVVGTFFVGAALWIIEGFEPAGAQVLRAEAHASKKRISPSSGPRSNRCCAGSTRASNCAAWPTRRSAMRSTRRPTCGSIVRRQRIEALAPEAGNRRRVGREEGQGLMSARATTLMIQPDAGLVPIVQAIRRAKRTVDIAIFRLNRTELETALGGSRPARRESARAWWRTRIGAERRGCGSSNSACSRPGSWCRAPAKTSSNTMASTLLVDGTQLYLFGFNYTKTDTNGSRSFGVLTRDRRAVRDASRLFECDLARQAYDGLTKSTLVVSPESSREALRNFIKGARRRLAIYDARIEDPTFIKLLRERQTAGVTVQVIGRARTLEPGTEVRMLKPHRLHVRAIIRDGTRAFVGSQSLRRLELDRRREVGLIITNPSVARRMIEVFDRDWEASGANDWSEKDKKDKEAKDKKDKDAKDDKDAKRKDVKNKDEEQAKERIA